MGFLSKVLGSFSGNAGVKVSDQLLFDKVIGFRGVVPGVGTSTVVQNVAYALSETTNFAVCVLDTNYLYPTQYPMLVSGADSPRKDFLDFNGELSDITVDTSMRNVTLVSMSNRTIVDMLSSRDNELVVKKVIDVLKSYFDIILVDISHEMSHISTHTAIKCNRIINVADQSLKCVYHLRKSLNTMATLAVPMAKANKVVINKMLPDVVTNTRGVMEDSGLTVIGEIPFSMEIAKNGVSGKKIWSSVSSNKDIYAFSTVINAVIDDVVNITPLSTKYIEVVKPVKEQVEDEDDLIIEDYSEEEEEIITEEIVTEEIATEEISPSEPDTAQIDDTDMDVFYGSTDSETK